MEFEQILQNLKKKIYHPVYFLCGDEPYYIDLLSDYIEKNVLNEAEKGFNQIIFYGKDTELVTVIETARRFPMMANQQVVIVKEAQAYKKLDLLEKYLEAPQKSTILVFNYKYGKPDGRTKVVGHLKAKGIYFESKKLYDNKIPGWIDEYVKSRNYSITPQASMMLSEYLGTELSKIANELNKLFIVLPEGTRLTPEHIEKNIGISKDYNVFELTSALGERNVLKANRIIAHFGANPAANPIQLTTGVLFQYFSKLFKYHFLPDKSERAAASALGLNPYIARNYIEAAKRYNPTKLFEIIGILREYDMKSKGLESSSGVSDLDLQKEMIYKILH